MDKIKVDFSKTLGKVKPMHSVNNGPVYNFAANQRITNIDHYILYPEKDITYSDQQVRSLSRSVTNQTKIVSSRREKRTTHSAD